jgi:hypothetical protein
LTQDANDFLMGGGVKSAKFEKPGAKVSGTIARKPELQQQRDFDSGKPLTWDDGSARQQVKVVLVTELNEEEGDNGERALYLKGGLLKAVQAAVKDSGAKGLEVDGKLAVKYTKDGEKKGKLNPPKLYVAKYEAPDPMAVAAATEPEAAAENNESLDDF